MAVVGISEGSLKHIKKLVYTENGAINNSEYPTLIKCGHSALA